MPSPSPWRLPGRLHSPVPVFSLFLSGSHHFLSASFPTQLPSSRERGRRLCVFLTFLDRPSHKHQRFTASSPFRFLCFLLVPGSSNSQKLNEIPEGKRPERGWLALAMSASVPPTGRFSWDRQCPVSCAFSGDTMSVKSVLALFPGNNK